MKVYVNYSLFDQEYVLIAANNKKEAIEVFVSEFGDDSDKFDCTNIYQAKGLDYDTTEPCVINI